MSLSKELEKRYGKAHLSYSSLKNALGDMAQFDRYMKGELKFKCDALDFGSMYDMLIFERGRAFETYKVLNEEEVLSRCQPKTIEAKKPSMTNDYKAVKETLAEEYRSDGKILTSHEDWKTANDMIDRLDSCGLLKSHLSGKFQVEFLHDINGVLLKGFLDCLGDGFITDSKSTRSVEKFRYSVRDFCYDIQAYIYTQAFGVKDFYWVAQEKTYPYLPALIKCKEETLFAGEMKFDTAVARIQKLLKDDTDPMTDFLSYEI